MLRQRLLDWPLELLSPYFGGQVEIVAAYGSHEDIILVLVISEPSGFSKCFASKLEKRAALWFDLKQTQASFSSPMRNIL